jgi:hypothetical protein
MGQIDRRPKTDNRFFGLWSAVFGQNFILRKSSFYALPVRPYGNF